MDHRSTVAYEEAIDPLEHIAPQALQNQPVQLLDPNHVAGPLSAPPALTTTTISKKARKRRRSSSPQTTTTTISPSQKDTHAQAISQSDWAKLQGLIEAACEENHRTRQEFLDGRAEMEAVKKRLAVVEQQLLEPQEGVLARVAAIGEDLKVIKRGAMAFWQVLKG